ncbi:peptidoglycan editing factor PgeF [Alkalibacillus sp. S2W]|uniref:peptidoglycan editing factor PgeF n=1 Tax=Alkalibacillus sp. S2W TaxID=3386553 RepID=UPI00398CA606
MNEPFIDQGTALMPLSNWDVFHVKSGFTTRRTGYSEKPYDYLNMALHVNDRLEDVLANRQYISQQLNEPLEHWRTLNQVHSTVVKDLTELDDLATKHDETVIDADGMITNDKNHVLTTFYADCVPLYFVAPQERWIGLAHAGWRGTVNGIADKMVEAFNQQGISSDALFVTIGPCISQPYYEVDEKVSSQIPNQFQQVLKRSQQDRYLLDLKELNRLYLQLAGVKPDQIAITQYCTYESSDLFYSFRRDHGQTGRMMAYLTLT